MNIESLQFPITTGRLTLRPFAAEDFSAYAAYHALPEVYRYLYAAPPAGADLQRQFDRALSAPFHADGDAFRLAVVTNAGHAVIGETVLKLASKAALQGEVGYIFNPAFAGKGYATEAVASTIDFGFSTFGFHRIFARLDAANRGSVGVVERLGLRREAHLVQNDRFDGEWGDEYIYAVLASEWRQRRATA
ncbi:GNAT family protein [Kaistia defluvii]|uniref:GNAT family N-acetyltransferase n=1 Tax=Kaistia defluvii TaxID=410841 RepID=UPI00224DCBE5|nr:GNAT family protein [Kaistia defluvii]MCX5520040.1 GNAT family protein [Kaistia defluvii]